MENKKVAIFTKHTKYECTSVPEAIRNDAKSLIEHRVWQLKATALCDVDQSQRIINHAKITLCGEGKNYFSQLLIVDKHL